mmetsp:Transcript_48036/g.85748  ORF Transcript_48036/g.85748 Transcript_48036/m.85748 type:complete len:263 (+) Transcript_48036:67-855(+)
MAGGGGVACTSEHSQTPRREVQSHWSTTYAFFLSRRLCCPRPLLTSCPGTVVEVLPCPDQDRHEASQQGLELELRDGLAPKAGELLNDTDEQMMIFRVIAVLLVVPVPILGRDAPGHPLAEVRQEGAIHMLAEDLVRLLCEARLRDQGLMRGRILLAEHHQVVECLERLLHLNGGTDFAPHHSILLPAVPLPLLLVGGCNDCALQHQLCGRAPYFIEEQVAGLTLPIHLHKLIHALVRYLNPGALPHAHLLFSALPLQHFGE